jgi:toxin ParE1/3/4
MEKYQLTNEAENEIESIYEYSILNFGLTTARDYISGLHKKFEVLADNQSWGSDYGFIRPDLCRYEYRSHSIYYKSLRDGILIVRVLGNRQDPARHF